MENQLLTDKSLLDLVHRVGQIGTERFAREYQGELTPRQLAVLRAVAAKDGASQTDIVVATGVDRSTTSDIVKRLVRRGLLRRRRSRKDARAYVVELTPDGQIAMDAAMPMLSRVEACLLETLPEDQRGPFLSGLEHILASQRTGAR